MGVHCEINVFKPPDGAFVPGSTVSGIIKYAVDEPTIFNKIVVALKGYGFLVIRDLTRKRRQHMYIYRNSEEYANVENIVHNNEKEDPVPIGSYEVPFTFTLPRPSPASLNYLRRNARFRVRCEIAYNISIKFERPGFLNFAKKYNKEITVVSGIKPRLPMEPTIYGEQKKIFKLFSNKNNIVNINATIDTCVIPPGGKVHLNYEIFNHSHLNLKGVETKLVETYTFTTKGDRKVRLSKDIEDSDSKTGAINSGASQNLDITITVPSDLGSLEYSNLVSRDYSVHIIAEIPFPHINAVLEIPLQIGDKSEPSAENTDDPPPSYWEAMHEEKEKEDACEDGDTDDEKS